MPLHYYQSIFRLRTAFLAAATVSLMTGSATAQGGKAVPAPTMRYLDNGHIRLGVDLNIGGAITYLAPSGSDRNVVNSHDWGRQIQMSFYSGPNPFAPNGKKPTPAWAGLGWNPIQSGDYAGNRSRVLKTTTDGKTLYVESIPMQWPLDNEPGECVFESWITLDGNVAHVASRLTNRRSDLTQYSGRSQELPAIYTNGPYYRLMTYNGDRPFTGDSLAQIPQKPPGSGFPWTPWQATENWAALVDDSGWGLGVCEPGLYKFLGGFSGSPGKGGPKDAPTGYIAPLHVDILDHDIVYGYRYDLILGTLAEIRAYAVAQAPKSLVPDYRFVADRRHWHYANAEDIGWPVQGELNVKLARKGPQLIGPDGFWSAEKAPTLYITAAFQTAPGDATVFFNRHDAPAFSAERSVRFRIIPDGKYHTYAVPLSSSAEYRGAITGLRLDPGPGGGAGDRVRIRYIGFSATP
jgi:hypothetical protein